MHSRFIRKPSNRWGQKVVQLMEQHNIYSPSDLEKLAQKQGIDLRQPTIHRILYVNKRAPELPTAQALAKFFNVPVSEILLTEPDAVMEPAAHYNNHAPHLSPEAIDIARRWQDLPKPLQLQVLQLIESNEEIAKQLNFNSAK